MREFDEIDYAYIAEVGNAIINNVPDRSMTYTALYGINTFVICYDVIDEEIVAEDGRWREPVCENILIEKMIDDEDDMFKGAIQRYIDKKRIKGTYERSNYYSKTITRMDDCV